MQCKRDFVWIAGFSDYADRWITEIGRRNTQTAPKVGNDYPGPWNRVR